MSRAPRPTLVLTFHTTAAAMQTQRACADAGIPGRLFPVPRRLSSDCGIAWASDPAERPRLEALMTAGEIEPAALTELTL